VRRGGRTGGGKLGKDRAPAWIGQSDEDLLGDRLDVTHHLRSPSVAVEVVAEFAELGGPAVDVAAERRVVLVVGQLSESGLDHRQPSAGTVGLEGELDIGTS